MKIKHSIERKSNVLEWQIIETIFEDGEERGDNKKHYTQDWKFYIESVDIPDISIDWLAVWGRCDNCDNDIVYERFNRKQEAQQVLDYINEFTVDNKMTKRELDTQFVNPPEIERDNNYYEKELQERKQSLENEKETLNCDIEHFRNQIDKKVATKCKVIDEIEFIEELLNWDLDNNE